MFTKRQRVATWVFLSGVSIFIGSLIGAFAEVYFVGKWFHTVALIIFASGAVLGVLGIALSFASLAWADWLESKNMEAMVSLSSDDNVVAVHKLEDAVVYVPVAGTTRQIILASNKDRLPFVTRGTLEHIHVANRLPSKIEVMDDDLYQKLFGSETN